MYGPVLRGVLATLKPPTEADAPVFIGWFAEPAVTAYMLRQFPLTLDEELEFLRHASRDESSILWSIEYEGRTVGTTGISNIDWPQQRGKTGIVIGDRSVWGRGIASEVMQMRTRFAFTNLALRKLHSSYLEGNEASWKAQQKVGYREVGRLHGHFFRDGKWVDEILTEILREDWDKQRRTSPGK